MKHIRVELHNRSLFSRKNYLPFFTRTKPVLTIRLALDFKALGVRCSLFPLYSKSKLYLKHREI